MPIQDKNFSCPTVFELRIWWRHVHTLYFVSDKALVTLRTTSRQVYFDNQKNCRIPVIRWPRQVRPTCPCVDRNLSTETNLQNIKCSVLEIQLSVKFKKPSKCARLSFFLSSFTVGYARLIMYRSNQCLNISVFSCPGGREGIWLT